MKINHKLCRLLADDEKVWLADGFDEALLGIVRDEGGPRAVYSMTHCIGILMRRDNMGRGEAGEYFDFNIAGSYVDKGPLFLEVPE